jgi:hypothetical protein
MAFDKAITTRMNDKPVWVFSKKNQRYNYAIGGSSRAHNNADILTIDEKLKTSGINIGFSGSALAENYLTLYFFLKQGNKIDNYILQIDDLSLMSPDSCFLYPFHEYYFFPYLNDEQICTEFKANCPYLKYLTWKYIPFTKYAEFNYIYPIHKVFIKMPPVFDERKGTELVTEKHKGFKTFDSVIVNKEQHSLSPGTLVYLNKIIGLCKEQKINIIFYTAPVYYKYYRSLNRAVFKSSIDSVCLKQHIKYYNFADIPTFMNEDLLYNQTHLNKEGTLLFSSFLADSLQTVLKK